MMTDAIPDDSDEPTGLLEAVAVREALGAIDDELLGSGDTERIREAIADALLHAEMRRAWREGLQGAGLDNPAARRALGAIRHAVRTIELDVHARAVQQAKSGPDAEAALATTLQRLLRDAEAEVDGQVPDLLDIYRLPSGALWAIPRDPFGRPLFWERERSRLVSDPRADRDWALANLGQVLGSGWRKARIGTATTVPEAEALCRRQPGAGDLFQRNFEAEVEGDEDVDDEPSSSGV